MCFARLRFLGRTFLSCGAGTGVAGLWLDEAFQHGSSGHTTTFNNDCLASSADFLVDGVEVWSFSKDDEW